MVNINTSNGIQITSSTGYGSSFYSLVDGNDYEYQQMKNILMAPKNDGDILMWKNGKYQWLPIKACFSYYNEMVK